MKYFVDTGAFVALYQKNDTYHEKAKTIWNRLRQENSTLYTTRDCIVETVILIRRRAGYEQALTCGNDLWDSPVLEIIRSTLIQDQLAWEWFKKYSDKELSFVDCLSFAVMKEKRIQQAFTFDKNFEQVGFEPLQP